MSHVPASWRSDPYGRFQLRWWDGERWTEHVATGGRQQVDPLGDSTVIPFAIPKTAIADTTDTDDTTDGGDEHTSDAPPAGFDPSI